jgi:hypothetical protein
MTDCIECKLWFANVTFYAKQLIDCNKKLNETKSKDNYGAVNTKPMKKGKHFIPASISSRIC